VILVTDPEFSDDVIVRCIERSAAVLPPGALCVQLRDKRRADASFRLFAARLRRTTASSGVWLVVNGRVEIARDVGADGVHLGGDSPCVERARSILARPSWISIAAHSDEDVARARAGGVDAALVSPIFETRSPSTDGSRKRPRGLGSLRDARRAGGPGVLLYALGGVTAASATACAGAGADGAALTRGLLGAWDPAREVRAIHDVWACRW
jgi:thiamine-phosphate pyrophosphorylase